MKLYFFYALSALVIKASPGSQGKADLVDKVNGFTFDLLKERLADTSLRNVLFSPVSIYSILFVVRLGAKANTRKELDTVLEWTSNENKENMRNFFKKIYMSNNKDRLAYANEIWVGSNNGGASILTSYIDKVKDIFQTNLVLKNLKRNLKSARQDINNWVAENTNDHIKNFFPEGSIDPTTNLLLVNAIFFQGNWKTKFDKKDTHDGRFILSNGNSIKVNYMWKNDRVSYVYDTHRKTHVLELPYEKNEFSMIITMQKNADETSLNSNDMFKEWIEKLRHTRPKHMDVTIPKFKLKQSMNLIKYFEHLGIHDLFTPGQADLSGINGRKNLFCGSASHQSFLNVDEEGTTAASGSGAGLLAMSMPPSIRIDRSFLFYIVRKPINVIMFAGRVADPTSN